MRHTIASLLLGLGCAQPPLDPPRPSPPPMQLDLGNVNPGQPLTIDVSGAAPGAGEQRLGWRVGGDPPGLLPRAAHLAVHHPPRQAGAELPATVTRALIEGSRREGSPCSSRRACPLSTIRSLRRWHGGGGAGWSWTRPPVRRLRPRSSSQNSCTPSASRQAPRAKPSQSVQTSLQEAGVSSLHSAARTPLRQALASLATKVSQFSR